MTKTNPIDQMFFDVADAIDAAQVQLAQIGEADIELMEKVLSGLYVTTDALLAQLAALPADAMKRFHTPLQHVLKHLEHFEQTMKAARSDIHGELQSFSKHKRAFNAYLMTPSGKIPTTN